MGGAYSANGKEEEGVQFIGGESQNEIDHNEDQNLDGVDFIGVAQESDKWSFFEKAVLKFLGPIKTWNFLSFCTTVGLWNSDKLHRITQLLNFLVFTLTRI